jgi:hypothetical protein
LGVEKILNDVTVGQYDVVMETGPGYNSKRQEAVDSMMTLLTADPELMKQAVDLIFRNIDFPGADIVADRLAAANPLAQIDEKSKYAKWRIIEIKKQLKSSQMNESNEFNQSNESISLNFENSNSIISPKQQHSQLQSQPRTTINQVPIIPQLNSPREQIIPNFDQVSNQNQNQNSPVALLYDPKVISNCEKHARHAISALQFDDIESAADNLRLALKLLQPYLKKNK